MKTGSIKKLQLLTLLIFVNGIIIYAQTNNSPFSFQGYAVDGEGTALGNEDINVQFSVYPIGGAVEYSEEHTLQTDAYGVFNAQIGSVVPAEFAKLNFYANHYKLKVEVKATTSAVYTTISDAPLSYVPYARAAANGVPVGTIVPFAGAKSKIPDGWLYCDGTPLNTSDYPQLFDAIGYGWGGSGGTFYLPDFRGLFMRGASDGTGQDPDAASRGLRVAGGNTGDNVGTYQSDQIRTHGHTADVSTDGHHNHEIVGAFSNDIGPGQRVNYDFVLRNYDGELTDGDEYTTYSGDHSHSVTINSNGGNETRPGNLAVYYIIKY